MNAQAALRGTWLLAELAFAAASFPVALLPGSGAPSHARRAAWLQRHCRRVLRVLGAEVQVEGPLPSRGLLVCNHLSYVDVLVLGSIRPMAFVAKRDVRGWPILGLLARFGGTFFVHRERPRASLRALAGLRAALDQGRLVALFPEGTSSDGSQVLPFKPFLLSSMRPGRHEVHAACIHYPAANGAVAEEICYWRDMTLLPHLLRLLGRRGISVKVRLSRGPEAPDRKVLAAVLQARVQALKHEAEAEDLRVPAPQEGTSADVDGRSWPPLGRPEGGAA